MKDKKNVEEKEGIFNHLPSGHYKTPELVREWLKNMGEDPDREGLRDSPGRIAEAYEYLTSGYRQDVKSLLKGAVFEEKYDEMVIMKDIDLFSICEHHLLPFYGKCHVAYIPKGKIIGLSKIPRIIEVFSRRLQVQERLTTQIAESFNELVRPLGVGVVIEAFHLCIAMRGVEKQAAYATTSAMLGAFLTHRETREEFLQLLNKKA
jgi:GTP cyclohydrolase I